MKVKCGQRTASLFLCLVLVLGLSMGLAPIVFAEEPSTPDWPQITGLDLDQCTYEWQYVVEGFTSELKGYKIEQNPELEKHSSHTDAKPRYIAGTITLYFDKLPTESERINDAAGVKFTPVGTEAGDYIKWHETSPAASNSNRFDNKNFNITWGNGNYECYSTERITATTSRCVEGSDGARYIYTFKLEEYSAPVTDLSISNGSAIRNSKTSATISLDASEDSSLYYSKYDAVQTNPVIDTTGDGIALVKGHNTFDISDLENGAVYYLYVVAKSGSVITEPLEIIIPEIQRNLVHEKQSFSGFGYNNAFYTERFLNASGDSITSAVPGETVTVELGAFEASPSLYISYSDGSFIAKGIAKQALSRWDITEGVMDAVPGSNVYTFTFTMPDKDVSTEAVGVPVSFSIINPVEGAAGHLCAYHSEEYDSAGYYYSIPGNGESFKVIPGTDVLAWMFLDAEGYYLDTIRIKNNGELVDESKIERNIDFVPQFNWTGNAHTIVEEGGDYTFEFVIQPKKFATVTVTSNDSNMGSATGSVENGSLALVYEGQTVTLTATPKEGYVLKEWQVKDDNGTNIPYIVDSEDSNKASFVMTADYSDEITATAVFVSDDYLPVTFNHTCLVQNSLAIAFKAGGVDWSEYSDIYLHIERQAYAKNDPECIWRIEDIRDYTIDDRGRCVYTYSGISAAEMGDQIKATVYATKDGKEYVSNTDIYSIATYAFNTLEKYKDNAALRTLLVDMLNYGSEAQAYFGKNVGNLVNAALTETQKSWATPGSISYENCKADGTFAGATARVSSRSLVLEETVKLKAYMTFDTTPGSNVKVVFRYTAASGQEKVTEVNSKEFVYDSAKNRYSAMLTTIAPPDFKKPISIKIYDGSTQISAEYTYSVESYAYSASQWEGSQYDALKTLVSAMIKYSRAAEAYFQQIQ